MLLYRNGMANGLLMSPFAEADPVAVGSLITLGTVGVKSGTVVDMDEPGLLGTPVGVIEPPPRLWAAASRPFSHAAPQASTAHTSFVVWDSWATPVWWKPRRSPSTTGSIRLYLISTAQGSPGTLKALRSGDTSHSSFAQNPDNPCLLQFRWSEEVREPDRTRQAR